MSRMALMVVGASTLVGSGSTLGTTSHPMRRRGQRHGCSVQMRLALCHSWTIFLDRMEGLVERVGLTRPYLASNGDGPRKVAVRATSHPLSLIDAVPHQDRHKLRSVAGLFHFWAIQRVQGLRRKLAAPTPDLPPSPLWSTRFTAQHCKPSETAQNIRNMVGAPVGTTRKRKRLDERAPTVIDTDIWSQEARQANDMDVVQWFTRTILQQTYTTVPSRKGPEQ